MNPWSTWIPVGVSAMFQLAISAFFYGRLTEVVRSNTKRIDSLDIKFTAQAEDITGQGNKIATIEGALRWQPGHDR